MGAEWNSTILAEDRLSRSPHYEEPDKDYPHGVFMGRPVIGRDTIINGGVYVGGGEREAIVVDDTKQEELNNIYADLIIRVTNRGGDFQEFGLGEVYKLVLEKLPYNESAVEDVVKDLGPDEKVGLNRFLAASGGVCRHESLLAGYLLERLVNEGHLRGKVSIDRNYVPGKGGHAWVRYTNSGGVPYIIDIAQEYIGRLSDKTEDRWFYERPEDGSRAKRFVDRIRRMFS